eukprot:scaffold1593_cov193-Alexandrium_tamarense.AAC.10
MEGGGGGEKRRAKVSFVWDIMLCMKHKQRCAILHYGSIKATPRRIASRPHTPTRRTTGRQRSRPSTTLTIPRLRISGREYLQNTSCAPPTRPATGKPRRHC